MPVLSAFNYFWTWSPTNMLCFIASSLLDFITSTLITNFKRSPIISRWQLHPSYFDGLTCAFSENLTRREGHLQLLVSGSLPVQPTCVNRTDHKFMFCVVDKIKSCIFYSISISWPTKYHIVIKSGWPDTVCPYSHWSVLEIQSNIVHQPKTTEQFCDACELHFTILYPNPITVYIQNGFPAAQLR